MFVMALPGHLCIHISICLMHAFTATLFASVLSNIIFSKFLAKHFVQVLVNCLED